MLALVQEMDQGLWTQACKSKNKKKFADIRDTFKKNKINKM